MADDRVCEGYHVIKSKRIKDVDCLLYTSSGKLRPFLIQLFGAVLGSLQMHLEIADSGIVGVQLVPMGGGKLFLWLLKPNGGIFRMNRLVEMCIRDRIAHYFWAERQLKIPAAVNGHGFRP